MNQEKALEIISVPADDKGVVEITPFGTDDRIKLSVAIVQKLIATPTKSGKIPDANQCMKFIMLCRSRHLNPFEGDAYLLGYDAQSGPQFSLITAHQVFLKRAEASKNFDGFSSGVVVMTADGIIEREGDMTEDGDKLLGGWCRVYLKNRSVPIYKRLKLSVFNTNRSRWEKDPAGMIVKCAEADALRTAFPTHLGGLFMSEEQPEIVIEGAKPIIQRARISDKGGDATLPPSTNQNASARQEDTTLGVERPVSNGAATSKPEPAPAQSLENQPVSDRTFQAQPKLTRKKREPKPPEAKKDEGEKGPFDTDASPSPDKTNEVKMLEFLTVGGFGKGDFMKVALANDWVSADERWPLPEEKLARFMSEEAKGILMEALEELKK